MSDNLPGILYVIATPIGNLDDFSPRAVSTLNSVSYILAEDTRHSLRLLQYFNIQTPVKALHEHNERLRVDLVISQLQMGESIALISDAGTPLISDPGYRLVELAQASDIKVVPIPGACAAIAALSCAGLPSDRFVFEGFLPPKKGARKNRLEDLLNEERTLIFYEAPHRIKAALIALIEVFGGEREAVIAKELTKMFETIRKGTLNNLLQWLEADDNRQRGEFVLLIAGKKQAAQEKLAFTVDELLSVLLEHVPLKQAVATVVELTGLSKKIIYPAALRIKN